MLALGMAGKLVLEMASEWVLVLAPMRALVTSPDQVREQEQALFQMKVPLIETHWGFLELLEIN